MTKLKDLLLENPDTLTLTNPDGTKKYIGYGGPSTVVTGLIFSDPIAGTKENYVALMDDPKYGQEPVVELHNQELNEKAVRFFVTPSDHYDNYSDTYVKRVTVDAFSGGRKGHGELEDFVGSMFDHLYKVPNKNSGGWGHYDETWRFRIFLVNDVRYFTIWQSSIGLYKEHLKLFVKIVEDCGFNPNEMIWEVRTDEVGDDRVKLVNMEGLHKLMGIEMTSPETQSEIQKRISELSKKLSEMESDEHVKGATWSQSEKRRHKIDMINIKAELDALGAAAKSGEKEIKNVIIKTIDSLADDEGDVIPADILYAELEKKLSHYGTSAVAIIRNLRDRGIDIKKALREINEKFDGKASVTELLSELSKYMNETIQQNAPSEFPTTDELNPCVKCGTKVNTIKVVSGFTWVNCECGNRTQGVSDGLGEYRAMRVSIQRWNGKNPTAVGKVNENEDTALVQPEIISRLKETATTPDAFLKIFKGHALKNLLDKLSFSRLYVMNKFGDIRGDHPQQRFVWMLDHAIAYINYRLIMPLRKKVDDDESEDQAKPDVIAQRRKKLEILKQAYAAQRHGDNDRASKLRQLHRDMEEPNTRYSANMKHMEAEVNKIHSTPLSLEELTPPGANDSERDRKNYEHYIEAFNQFKGN